jgi:membrane protease YdiL (CAAX protease family)
MKNAIIYWFVFLALQVLAGGIIQGVYILWKGPGAVLDATGTILTMVLFSVATMALFLWQKWAVVARHWIQTRPWVVLIWCVLAALGTIIPSGWLQEQMPELSNLVEEEFDMILRDRYGYFVVGLLVPLAEELVFRGAILRSLLKWNSRPWVAILISAVLFSAAHMNPAQIPHTLLIGLLLGWLYYRTDSIVPGVVFHWVNNTVAYVLYNFYPNPDLKLVDLFGSQQHVLMAVGFSLCILIPSLIQLNLRMRK